IFTPEQEDALVIYIKKCANHYYGLSISELRLLAYQFALKLGIAVPDNWQTAETAGIFWYYGFMERHKSLSLRKPENTSLNRVKAFNRESVGLFFNNLDAVLTDTMHEPANIWNMDETGFSTVPGSVGKIIAIRGVKKVGQMTSGERGQMITMALSVSAAGNSMPPLFLFPKKNMQKHYMTHATPGAVGYANDSGWMKQPEFLLFMKHFVKYSHASKENPNLLLIDNHSSHLSVEALDYAAEHGITLLSFPPHCSHKLQPLDVSVYGPVKSYYEQECRSWSRNTQEKIEMFHIPELVRSTLDLALTPINIKSGFRGTGIFPYNPNIFSDIDYVEAPFVENENNGMPDESQRLLLVTDAAPDVGAETEVSTTDTSASTTPVPRGTTPLSRESTPLSRASTPLSRASSLASILSDVGPLKPAKPKPPSKKRGPKPMKSAILTSPESLADLRAKKAKRDAAAQKKAEKMTSKRTPKAQKKPGKAANTTKAQKKAANTTKAQKKAANTTKAKKNPVKASKPKSPPKRRKQRTYSSKDEDFCTICMQAMPQNLTTANSIACI
ncbi:uncharacterized protein LOC129571221, partial [Sitodiplosis mosellana]|uniref:uncharacterized protein LOC129571221 n=1 Tax=Sitodiplosis mosellana TaxID=263140 RepID=UPI002444BD57